MCVQLDFSLCDPIASHWGNLYFRAVANIFINANRLSADGFRGFRPAPVPESVAACLAWPRPLGVSTAVLNISLTPQFI